MSKVYVEDSLVINDSLENLKNKYSRLQKFKFICEECGKEYTKVLCCIHTLEKSLCKSCGNPNRKYKNKGTENTVFVDLKNCDPQQVYPKTQQISFNCKKCGKLTERPNYSDKYFCKDCLSKLTKIEKYGSLEAAYSKMVQNCKTTCKQKYGVDSYFRTQAHINEVKNRAEEVKQIAKTKRKETNLKKFGVPVAANTVENINKRSSFSEEEREEKKRYLQLSLEERKEYRKQKNLQTYGVESKNQLESVKRKVKETKRKNGTLGKHSNYKFEYLNEKFDSFTEAVYFQYEKDLGNRISRNLEKYFEYEFNNEIHKYYPDFIVNGEFVEIKGDQFFDKNGKMQNPFDHSQDQLFEAKHQCMLKNSVKILKHTDIVNTIGKKYFLEKKVKIQESIS